MIRRAARGERVIDSGRLVEAIRRGPPPLTERQRVVISAIADGASVAEAAQVLRLTPGTVRNYLSTAVAKLGARNRIDAVRIARAAGWIA